MRMQNGNAKNVISCIAAPQIFLLKTGKHLGAKPPPCPAKDFGKVFSGFSLRPTTLTGSNATLAAAFFPPMPSVAMLGGAPSNVKWSAEAAKVL